MFEVAVETDFCAAHKLRGYKGKCARLHGHNFKLSVTIYKDKLNKIGLAVDFMAVKKLIKKIINRLDHRNLNDIAYFKKNNPSCEHVAKYIYDQLKKTFKNDRIVVKVWESPRNSVTYTETE